MELNYYSCLKSATIEKNIAVDDWLRQIQTKTNYSEKILYARQVGKGDVYDKIKEVVPAVTWNFNFDTYKKDSNIVSSTGLIYFDIDNSNFSLSQIDASKIFCHYKSFGGNGFAVIVRADGVTKENFKTTYKKIATLLGIERFIDINAIKKSQYNVLSYDPDLYYNPNSFVFDEAEKGAIPPPSIPKRCNITPKVSSPSSFLIIGEIAPFQKLPFYLSNNRGWFANETDIFENKDGVDYIELFLPATIPMGKRNVTLLAYCNNFVLLNPDWTWEQVFAHLMHKNKKRCSPPDNGNAIAQIVTSIFKLKEDGNLKAVSCKKRKIIFGTKTGLTASDKISHSNTVKGAWKREKTMEIIQQAIKSVSGKVTAPKIVSITGLSLRTVKTYLKLLK